jgi:uncharacterized membrane protein YfcA
MQMEHWLLFVVVGLVCGIFSATFGVGSGIILVPALVLLFQFPQKTAQGVCLCVMVPMAMAGAWRYIANPSIVVNFHAAVWLALGGVFGAVIGAYLAGRLPATSLRKMFAVVMIVAATRMLMTRPKAPQDGPVEVQTTEQSG